MQAVHSDLTVGTTKLSAELAEATKRVAVQVSAHDALTAALEGHAARLAVGSGWTPEQLSKQRELKDAVAEAHTVLDSKRLVVSL